MADFNLDQYKKSWQEQDKTQFYSHQDLLTMLNKKSRNYVKYILWISIAELLIFGGLTVYYFFQDDQSSNLLTLMGKMGVSPTHSLKADLAHLNFLIKLLSLLVTGVFVFIFYKNYRKINIESNIKTFIVQIFNFKKTVRYFILTNIVLLVVFNFLMAWVIYFNINEQNIHLQSHNWWVFVMGILFTCALSLLLIYIYYKILYGIILKKLSKNLDQLKDMEKQN